MKQLKKFSKTAGIIMLLIMTIAVILLKPYTALAVSDNKELGIESITADKAKDVLSGAAEDDLSDIPSLQGVSVLYGYNSYYSTSFQGDVYILPNSVITMYNVSVSGTVYVLGALRANSIAAGAIRARSIMFGGLASGNGAVSLSGSCSVSSLTASNVIVDDVPIRLDDGVKASNGKISLKGIYANVANLYIENKRVTPDDSGRFSVKDLTVQNATALQVKLVTVEGNTLYKYYSIRKKTADSQGRNIVFRPAEEGWKKDSKGWWYQNDDGTYPVRQWFMINGRWYRFDADGYMLTGWQKISDKWYYLGEDGAMQTGWQKISDKWYYFENGGIMVTGWKQLSGKWYYFAPGGVMQIGWKELGGNKYYFSPAAGGAMVTGWQDISDKRYYFGNGGAMITGWKELSGKRYYFTSDGVMQTAWKKIGDNYYYFKPDGVMAAREWCKGYWLNSDGTWTYQYKASWKENAKGWWYGDTSGWYANNATITIDDKSYTFDANGYWVK